MKRQELIELAKIVAERQMILAGMGMVNVANQTPEQRVDLDAAYKVARDELAIAEGVYQTALQSYVPEQ